MKNSYSDGNASSLFLLIIPVSADTTAKRVLGLRKAQTPQHTEDSRGQPKRGRNPARELGVGLTTPSRKTPKHKLVTKCFTEFMHFTKYY
jgi:hypothetical protein